MRRDTSSLGDSFQANGGNAISAPVEQRATLDAHRAHEGVLASNGGNGAVDRISMSHEPIMQISCTFGNPNGAPETLHSHLGPWVRHSGVSATSHKLQVGDRLRTAIEAVGKKQVEICRMFGVAPSKLGNWLRGEHYPDPWFIVRFCDRFNVSADYFYRGRVSSAMDAPLADALWAAEEEARRGQAAAAAQAPETETQK